ncbi:MAG TPA: putative baseplate assembly protein [Pseudonocardiaceae bacterium]
MSNAQQGDCCAGIEPVTPVDEQNRPGLAALNYRVGTHGQFLTTMLARLSSTEYPQLRAFKARDTSDLAVALLDGWATVADVLSFYTERLANEGFVRTALDPRSVALLGALVGYAPRPGLGASTYLAYTVDNSAPRIVIPAGSRAQNVPIGGATAQSYETGAELIASVDWNDLPVRMTEPTSLSLSDVRSTEPIYLAGTTTNLKPNDRLLFDFGPTVGVPIVKPVVAVTPDLATKRTQVAFAVETPEQLYTDAIGVLLATLADVRGPDPILANAVSWILPPLITAIGDPTKPNPPRTVASPLRTALGELSEEVAVAQIHADGYAALRLASATAAAQAVLDAAVHVDPVGAAPPSSFGEEGPQGPTGAGAVAGITGLLGPLRLPPSVPPANSAALTRSTGQAFQAGSDTSIGLLAAADPRLSAQLYTALSTVDLTPTPPLRDVQALRVTPAPFGANAPLKPVTNSQGVVIDHTEWPLAGIVSWSVTFDDIFSPVYSNRTSFVISYSDGSVTWTSQDVSLDADAEVIDQTVQLGPVATAHCTITSTVDSQGTFYTLNVVLTAGQLVRTLIIGLPQVPTTSVNFEIIDGSNNLVELRVYSDGTPVSGTAGTDAVSAVWLEVQEQLARKQKATATTTASVPMTVTDQLAPPLTTLNLDAIYPGIVRGSWVVIDRPTPDTATLPIQVLAANTVSVAAYGLTGKVTQLTLARPWLDGTDLTLAPVRRTTVRAQGDSLQLAQTPVTADIQGATIDLATTVNGLRTGRWLVVAGDRTDVPNARIPGGELVMLAGTQQIVDTTLPGDTVRTLLTLSTDLAYTYARDTVHVYGNVVEADQGATRTEPIGSGDATATNQKFSLSSTPLTYLPADNPGGAQDTLVLRVNGVRWHETDTLATAGPTDHVFVLTNGDKTTVTFGDGVHGARLPTGVENVTATYRTGLGTGGNVPAGSITQPTSRPLGVRGVTNPLPATGGADPDTSAVARANTPLRTYALDRLVSVRDYADFSAARAGIGRASAQRLTDGKRDVIHLTVTGVDDAPIDPTDELVRDLRTSLAEFGDAHLPIVVAVRDLVLLVISASVKVLPDYSWPLVEPVVRAAVLDLLSPAARDLGQPAYASEVISTIQAVPGVDYVDLTVFAGIPGSISPDDLNTVADQLTGPANTVVPAALAEYQEQWYEVKNVETLSSIAAANNLTVSDLVRLNPWLPNAELPTGSSDPLWLLLRHGIAPAQLAVASPTVPDSLILKEITS